MRMLEDANMLLQSEGSPQFKRLTGKKFRFTLCILVSFKDYEYLVTLDSTRVYVYLRNRTSSD
jgi:hypothetical protein